MWYLEYLNNNLFSFFKQIFIAERTKKLWTYIKAKPEVTIFSNKSALLQLRVLSRSRFISDFISKLCQYFSHIYSQKKPTFLRTKVYLSTEILHWFRKTFIGSCISPANAPHKFVLGLYFMLNYYQITKENLEKKLFDDVLPLKYKKIEIKKNFPWELFQLQS